MPIVWDAELGKYVAKKAAPPVPVASSPPPEDDEAPLPEVDIPTMPASGSGADNATLQRAITAAETLKYRAQVAEAKAREKEKERYELEKMLASGQTSTGHLEQMLASKGELVAAKVNELKGKDAQLEAKRKEIAELQAQHKAEIARVQQEGRDALEAAISSAKAEAVEVEAAHASTLATRDEAHRTASEAAAEEHARTLEREIERERAEQMADYEHQLAELKAAFARESGEVKRGHTKEMAELLAALNKQKEQRKKHDKHGGGTSSADAHGKGSNAASHAKTASVISKAQAKAESWEIANLGRNTIELVHLIYERLEKLVSIADDEANQAKARLSPEELSSEDVPLPTELKTRAQAHAAMEELDFAREQLYAQLYSNANMLGHHYLKNYPMTETPTKSTQKNRTQSNDFPPDPKASAAPAAPATTPASPAAAATPAANASSPPAASASDPSPSGVRPKDKASTSKPHKGGKDKPTGHKPPYAHEASIA